MSISFYRLYARRPPDFHRGPSCVGPDYLLDVERHIAGEAVTFGIIYIEEQSDL